MSRMQHVYRAQEGAVFVQVGIALFVLMAFNVFVLDYGVLWVARGQAQNAADAGALAGAVARGFDDFDDPPHPSGFAALVAQGVAQANSVWRQPATPVVNFDCPAGVTGRLHDSRCLSQWREWKHAARNVVRSDALRRLAAGSRDGNGADWKRKRDTMSPTVGVCRRLG